MDVWTKKAVDLADEYPEILRTVGEKAGDVPAIARPLDAFIGEMLADYAGEKLHYNPLRVDELSRALGLRLDLCTNLREQAYQLDQDSFREVLDIKYRTAVIAAARDQLEWSKLNEPKRLGNMDSLTIENDMVVGPKESRTDWEPFFKAQSGQITAMEEELADRKARLSDRSSPGSFVSRHEQIKKHFAIDLTEAWRLANSLRVGLRELYFLIDSVDYPFPDIGQKSFLDSLVGWAKSTDAEVQRILERQKAATVIIPFHLGNDAEEPVRLMPKTGPKGWENQIPNGSFQFEIGRELLDKFGIPENARVRGVDLWLDDSNPAKPTESFPSPSLTCSASIELPDQSAAFEPFDTKLKSALPPCRSLGSLDPFTEPGLPRPLSNASPIGLWRVEIATNGARGEALPTVLTNLFLRIRFAWWAFKK